VPVTRSADFSLLRIQRFSPDRAAGIFAGGAILKPKGGVFARIAALLRSNTHRKAEPFPPSGFAW
jgi:hypothetical protein